MSRLVDAANALNLHETYLTAKIPETKAKQPVKEADVELLGCLAGLAWLLGLVAWLHSLPLPWITHSDLASHPLQAFHPSTHPSLSWHIRLQLQPAADFIQVPGQA